MLYPRQSTSRYKLGRLERRVGDTIAAYISTLPGSRGKQVNEPQRVVSLNFDFYGAQRAFRKRFAEGYVTRVGYLLVQEKRDHVSSPPLAQDCSGSGADAFSSQKTAEVSQIVQASGLASQQNASMLPLLF
jgi:hypothetical protein